MVGGSCRTCAPRRLGCMSNAAAEKVSWLWTRKQAMACGMGGTPWSTGAKGRGAKCRSWNDCFADCDGRNVLFQLAVLINVKKSGTKIRICRQTTKYQTWFFGFLTLWRSLANIYTDKCRQLRTRHISISLKNEYVFIRQPIRIHRPMNTYSQANQYVSIKQGIRIHKTSRTSIIGQA